ncbi:MAG: hypothetical protein U1E27_12670 [Kiritimatiellia bacterium]|nr:hypothetical protein [Kiritimatiellia bacterium]
MKRWMLGVGFLMAASLAVGQVREGDVPLRMVQIQNGKPLPSGISVIEVRMTPVKTVEIARIVFHCTLHQEFLYKGSDGREKMKKVEPALFVHREENVKLTADLDKYLNFRVDLREPELIKAYGARTFKAGIPATVSKVRMDAQSASGETLWEVTVPMGQTINFP